MKHSQIHRREVSNQNRQEDWDTVHSQMLDVQRKNASVDNVIQRKEDSDQSMDKEDSDQSFMDIPDDITFGVYFDETLSARQITSLNNIASLINNYDAASPGLIRVDIQGGDEKIVKDATGNAAMRAANRANTLSAQFPLAFGAPQVSISPLVATVQALQNRDTPPVYASDYATLGVRSDKVHIILRNSNFSPFRQPFIRRVSRWVKRM